MGEEGRQRRRDARRVWSAVVAGRSGGARFAGMGSVEAWRAPHARQGDPLLLFPARHGPAQRSLVSADPTRRRGTRGASRRLGLLARREHVIRLLERALVRFSGVFRRSGVTSRREYVDLTSDERAVAARASGQTRKGESARRDVGRGKAPPKIKRLLATRLVSDAASSARSLWRLDRGLSTARSRE